MSAYAWTLRVTSPDRRTARVACRRQQFVVSRPLNFDSEHDGVSALEYALGALAGELVTGVRELARRRRLELDDVEAVITGELHNPLAYLEVAGETGDARVTRIALKVYVTSPAPEDAVKTLVRDATGILPLARTLRDLVRIELEVVCS
jgi:uncharacterized OsmC-like protein